MQILVRTPIWVWPLLAALIGLGVMQMRARTTSRVRTLILPFVMVALSIASLLGTFGPLPEAFAAWAAAVVLALALNQYLFNWPRGVTASADGSMLAVPGSVVPLILIMCIFCIRFVTGATAAMQPRLLVDPVFASAIACALGLCSGMFVARAIMLLRAPPEMALA